MKLVNLAALSELATMMDSQVAMLDDLCDLGRKKTALLVNNDLPGLETVVRAEQALLFKLGRLEERRFRQQQLMQGEAPATLQQLVDAAPGPWRERMSTLQERYGYNVKELERLRQTNGRLIEQALTYIDFTLELIAAARAAGQTYTDNGKRKSADQAQPVLDNRA